MRTPAAPRIVSAAAALCPHRYTQEEILAVVAPRFERALDLDRYRPIFAHSGVEVRQLVLPVEELLDGAGWLREQERFVTEATRLGKEALCAALDRAAIAPGEVDHLFFVTSTGIAAPTVDARLIGNGIGRPDTRRSPLWGLGCAGGASALGRAAEWLRGHPDGVAAVLCVEFCSQTYLPEDRTLENFVASALFGDGVGAAVLVGGNRPLLGASLEIVGQRATLFPDTLQVMGWTPVAEGLQVVFDRRIPALVREHAGAELAALARESGIDRERISRFWGHPGGPKVVAAYADALRWPEPAFALAGEVLREHGNMSSSTIVHVLARAFESGWEIAGEEFALLAALGPGFTSEQLLVRRLEP